MRRLCYNGDKSRVVMDYLESSMQLVHFELPNRMQGGLQGNTMKELMELGRLAYLNQDQYGSWKVNSYNASSWDPIQIPCQQMNRLPRCLCQTAWPSLSWRMSFFTGWRHLRIYKYLSLYHLCPSWPPESLWHWQLCTCILCSPIFIPTRSRRRALQTQITSLQSELVS